MSDCCLHLIDCYFRLRFLQQTFFITVRYFLLPPAFKIVLLDHCTTFNFNFHMKGLSEFGCKKIACLIDFIFRNYFVYLIVLRG